MPPFHGHLNPLLPVMRILVQGGVRVICYNHETFRAKIEATGADFRAYPGVVDPVDFTERIQTGNLAAVTSQILNVTEALLPALLKDLRRLEPELLVFDSVALWGKMAATCLGLNAAASISHFVMDEQQIGLRDLLPLLAKMLPQLPAILGARRRLRQQYGSAFPAGSPLFPMRADLNLIFTARELQPETKLIDARFCFVGPALDPHQPTGTFPLPAGEGPLVYVSLGTVHHFEPAFLQVCLKAFAGQRARFLLAVGPLAQERALSAGLPENICLQVSVPQQQVLAQTDLFISHGGMNSVQESLWHGVPLVLIPHQFEQLLNARCVAARGAGVILEQRLQHKLLTSAQLRLALNEVLHNPAYHTAARELSQLLRATGGPELAAAELLARMPGCPRGGETVSSPCPRGERPR